MEVLQEDSDDADEEGRRPGGGNLGSGWTRVPPGLGETGPPEKGGLQKVHPRLCAGGLRKQECTGSPGPDPRPQTPGRTDNITAIY